MPTFSVGDRARLSFAVFTTGSSGADTVVTLAVNAPSGAKWVATANSTAGSSRMRHDGKGQWHSDYPISEPGRHTWAVRSTGAVTATTGGAFTARPLPAST